MIIQGLEALEAILPKKINWSAQKIEEIGE